MPLFVPDFIRSLKPYVPGKPIEETQRQYGLKRVIKLASNENPLGPSPRAVAAIRGSLKELHRYPDASAWKFKQALIKYHKKKWSEVSLDRLSVGNGSNEMIDLLIRTFARPGDTMVTTRAAFVAYSICAQIHGVNTWECAVNDAFEPDLEQMAKKIESDPSIKIVFIANPNNPTGVHIPHGKLWAFLERVEKVRDHSVLVVLDYAYWEYVTAKDLTPPELILKRFSGAVVLRTFSKIYGLAGIRLGYAMGHPQVLEWVERIRQPFNFSSTSLIAGEAALADTAFVKRALRLNQAGKKMWTKALTQWKVPFLPSEGNFYLVNTQKGWGMPGKVVFEACLKKGVIFRPVDNYRLPDFLRVGFGTEAENRMAIRVMGEL